VGIQQQKPKERKGGGWSNEMLTMMRSTEIKQEKKAEEKTKSMKCVN